MLVDSHVNLHGERYRDDLEEVITRAQEAGVAAMLAISDHLGSTEEIEKIVRGRQNMWRTVGVHPHHAAEDDDITAARLVSLAEPDEVVGIGECGLDLHYEYSPYEDQEPVFRAHAEAARRTGLPLVIHCRNADEPMRRILKEEREKGAFVPLLHCYTGGIDLAREALAMGGYVAFSGILTFKKAEAVRAVAEEMPLDRLLVETDCPFLAPVPYRGRRNEPAYLTHVADALAQIKGVSRNVLDEATTENFFALFSRAVRS